MDTPRDDRPDSPRSDNKLDVLRKLMARPESTRPDNKNDTLRVPPHSVESEQSVLGGLLIDPSRLQEVRLRLNETDFYRRDHRLIYRAICTLAEKGTPFDAVTLGEWLEANNLAEQIGGTGYLVELGGTTPSAANIRAYAEIVREKSLFRQIIEAGTETVNSGFTPNGRSAAEALAESQSRLKILGENAADVQCCFVSAGELLKESTPVAWLIRNVFSRDAVGALIGNPDSGKSFLAIDWACSVATGTPWNGHEVTQGPVFYICGEGHNAFSRRLLAWQTVRGVELASAPLFVTRRAIVLTDPGASRALVATINSMARSSGTAPALIVIDTLARSFQGDENSAQDIGAFLATVDNFRAQWGCSVKIVHHSGHAEKGRGRGSSALRGAFDWEYNLERDGKHVTLSCAKAKDAAVPAPLFFEISGVDLPWQDDMGEPQTSAILRPVSEVVAPVPSHGLGKRQQRALTALQDLYQRHRDRLADGGFPVEPARVTVEDWKIACQFDDRQAFHKVKADLTDRGEIRLELPYVHLA